jgi:O-antigen/teichoic acid export membrane protein
VTSKPCAASDGVSGGKTSDQAAGIAVVPDPVRIEKTSGLQGRNARLFSGIVVTLVTKAVGVAVPLLQVPLTLGYLGADLYGLWMAIAAATGMAAFADLGLGNGLMTKVADSYARRDFESARKYVATAYFTVSAVAVLSLLALWLSAWGIPWHLIFNAKNVAIEETRWMALICLSAFLINLPLALIVRVQYACQQVRQSGLWQAAGMALTIPFIAFAVAQRQPAPAVILASLAGPLIMTWANTLWFFWRGVPELAPSIRAVDRRVVDQLVRISSLFFVLTVVMTVSASADSLIVSHVLTLSAVTAFSVPARLFAQVGVLVSVMNLPLWPANAEALAAGDIDWVRRITRRMIAISASTTLVTSLALAGAGDELLELWLGMSLGSDGPLLLGLSIWWIMVSAISPIFMVQNAGGIVRPQLFGWVGYLIVSVPAKLAAVEHWGVAAIPWTGVAVYAFTVVPGAIVGYRTALANGSAARLGRKG